MRKIITLLIAIISTCSSGYAQQSADSSHELNGIVVKDSAGRKSSSFNMLEQSYLQYDQSNRPITSLLQEINTTPGVRMEERSPGSYRLSIRGSLIRSPFGIRNVKIYFEDIPLTDASGNTYLNLLDPEILHQYNLYIGAPDNALGSNTGGAVDFKTVEAIKKENQVTIDVLGGSYGLYKVFASEALQHNNWQLDITASYQKSDGYRVNSAFDRKYVHIIPQWQYCKIAHLKIVAVYSDLYYQTPGGLTLSEFETNPKAARPDTKVYPGAVAQQAAIYNKTFLGGLVHELRLAPHLSHFVALSAMTTDFTNPFITNYEKRSENTYSLRTYLADSLIRQEKLGLVLSGGWEGQTMHSMIDDYDNNKGVMGSPQSANRIITNQQFFWAKAAFGYHRLAADLSTSYGTYDYTYSSQYPTITGNQTQHFNPELMPRLLISYHLNNYFTPFAIMNRGYSSPTQEEVLSSNQIINTNLQAESGWNHELGFQLHSKSQNYSLQVNAYDFELKNTIVPRLLPNEEEYYVNTGNTRQLGLEAHLHGNVWPYNGAGFVNKLTLDAYYTGDNYHFVHYQSDSFNYSGNKITGIPDHVVVVTADVRLLRKVDCYLQYTYTSAIPLNDANSVSAAAYHLLQAKISYDFLLRHHHKLQLYAVGDNLLNQHYSLGDDLNAVNGRYYNAAPAINFYGGVKVVW